ncbi:MAG: hypothetical protein IV100_26520 [Myxococcales bacterium]|nr:hypothetical protein [Myxococcales bacterium]
MALLVLAGNILCRILSGSFGRAVTRVALWALLKELGIKSHMACYVHRINGQVIHTPTKKGGECTCQPRKRNLRGELLGEEGPKVKDPKRIRYVLGKTGNQEKDGLLRGAAGYTGSRIEDDEWSCVEELYDRRVSLREVVRAGYSFEMTVYSIVRGNVVLDDQESAVGEFILRTDAVAPQKAASELFGVTEGRISQIVSSINAKLRAFTGDHSVTLSAWRQDLLGNAALTRAYEELASA